MTTAWGQEIDWRLERTVFGHGSYGYECKVCGVSDWGGPIEHKGGCDTVALLLRALRDNELVLRQEDVRWINPIWGDVLSEIEGIRVMYYPQD